jgi:hypothetical protein
MATVTQILERARDNYARILVLVTQLVSDTTSGATIDKPTRTQIDAVVTAADGAGIMRPRVTNSLGNRSIDWTGYQTFIVQQISALDKLIVERSGPWEVRTRGVI